VGILAAGVERPAMLEGQQPVIRVTMMPRDTNAHGTIFGGVILSYIDQAGAVEAYRHVTQKLVTVAIKEVVFHEPVRVGDLVSLFAEATRFGRTSITVAVKVYAHRLMTEGAHDVKVTEAELTYVAVDGAGRPTPLRRLSAQSLTPQELRPESS
jgi:acyl-CoA thioesterase YciA